MNLDELELAVRKLRGVLAVGFVEDAGLLLVEVQAGAEAYPELPRDVSHLAADHAGGPVAVEVVRWGDGGPRTRRTRLRLEEITTDPLRRASPCAWPGWRDRFGRAATTSGLLSAVEATVYAIRAFLPDLGFLLVWARWSRRPPTAVSSWLRRSPIRHLAHRRGTAEGATPIGRPPATLAALNRTISRETGKPRIATARTSRNAALRTDG